MGQGVAIQEREEGDKPRAWGVCGGLAGGGEEEPQERLLRLIISPLLLSPLNAIDQSN